MACTTCRTPCTTFRSRCTVRRPPCTVCRRRCTTFRRRCAMCRRPCTPFAPRAAFASILSYRPARGGKIPRHVQRYSLGCQADPLAGNKHPASCTTFPIACRRCRTPCTPIRSAVTTCRSPVGIFYAVHTIADFRNNFSEACTKFRPVSRRLRAGFVGFQIVPSRPRLLYIEVPSASLATRIRVFRVHPVLAASAAATHRTPKANSIERRKWPARIPRKTRIGEKSE